MPPGPPPCSSGDAGETPTPQTKRSPPPPQESTGQRSFFFYSNYAFVKFSNSSLPMVVILGYSYFGIWTVDLKNVARCGGSHI